MTDYIVFRKNEEAGAWEILIQLEAASSKAAVRTHLAKFADPGTEGSFAACPARSWNVVKVQVETALKFS